jgi:hypothetical protein
MMMRRRTFILGAGSIVTAPALANLPSPSATARSHASLLPDPLPPQLPNGRTDMKGLVFKIDGWDRREDIAIDGSAIVLADAATNDAAGEQVWISINRSWRTAWR